MRQTIAFALARHAPKVRMYLSLDADQAIPEGTHIFGVNVAPRKTGDVNLDYFIRKVSPYYAKYAESDTVEPFSIDSTKLSFHATMNEKAKWLKIVTSKAAHEMFPKYEFVTWVGPLSLHTAVVRR